MEPLAATLEELLAHRDWFVDPVRGDGREGPPILVIDDFYDDPYAVRALALEQRFVAYNPPDPAIVGAAVADALPTRSGRWSSTAFKVFRGTPVEYPFDGFRLAPDALRERLEDVVGETVDAATWATSGDGWNGAFHLIEGEAHADAWSVHHHYKAGDISGRGWSGLVYLSPDAPPESGTTIWRERASGRCVAPFGATFDAAGTRYDLAHRIANRFNRLVLFHENLLHRAEAGFGSGRDARLTQTIFFNVGDTES